ncbi:MAG: hypothetical protein EBV06_10335 [Planctomycetia bacterium]|nr:hypothetical protein [Planctomycetia bacterium]
MKRLLTLVACAALLATGCIGMARYVEVRPDGGVVSIPSNTNFWPTYHRDAAAKLMADKCPNGYTITEEREIVVGEEVRTTASGPLETKISSPTTEYRIAFRSTVQVPSGNRPSSVAPSSTGQPADLPSRPVPID